MDFTSDICPQHTILGTVLSIRLGDIFFLVLPSKGIDKPIHITSPAAAALSVMKTFTQAVKGIISRRTALMGLDFDSGAS